MLRSYAFNKKILVATKTYMLGDTIRHLQGKILSSPTQTSVELDIKKHIEDEYASWMNHSCLPSCVVYNGKIIAQRKIFPGIELTFNYIKNETELANPFYCSHCNSNVKGKKSKCPVYFCGYDN
jgi:hypothetical protein